MSVELCEPWVTVEEATSGDFCAPCAADVSEALLEQLLEAASYVLFVKTGSQWPGVCEETVRPCARRASDYDAPVWHGVPLSNFGGAGYAYGFDWGWNTSWGFCSCSGHEGRDCCGGPSEISLGGYPLDSIVEVLIDGDVLDPSCYRIDDQGWLVRLPDVGETTPRRWPCCQRLDLDTSEEHTFAVTYRFGSLPPTAGKLAVASLACDLAAACSPDSDCAVPANVSQMLRENVQYQFVVRDDPTALDDNLTGNRLADLFIKTVNPGGISEPASVWSPDVSPRVRRTGTQTS